MQRDSLTHARTKHCHRSRALTCSHLSAPACSRLTCRFAASQRLPHLFAPSCHQLQQPAERCLRAHPFISRHAFICLLSLASCAADVSLAPVWLISAPPVASAAAALTRALALTHSLHASILCRLLTPHCTLQLLCLAQLIGLHFLHQRTRHQRCTGKQHATTTRGEGRRKKRRRAQRRRACSARAIRRERARGTAKMKEARLFARLQFSLSVGASELQRVPSP